MKIVVTGATGFVGSGVLEICIEDSRITSIVALSCRELPVDLTSNEKLKVIIHQDFSQYPDELLHELRDARACLWYRAATGMWLQSTDFGRAIGGKVGDFPDLQTAKRVQIDYTLAGAEAFANKVLPISNNNHFRFVFCSGEFASRDQEESLWFMKDTRRIKVNTKDLKSKKQAHLQQGQIENGLIGITKVHPGFETYIVRPGGILPKDSSVVMSVLRGFVPSIKVTELASIMVEIALSGHGHQTLENSEIAKLSSTLGSNYGRVSREDIT